MKYAAVSSLTLPIISYHRRPQMKLEFSLPAGCSILRTGSLMHGLFAKAPLIIGIFANFCAPDLLSVKLGFYLHRDQCNKYNQNNKQQEACPVPHKRIENIWRMSLHSCRLPRIGPDIATQLKQRQGFGKAVFMILSLIYALQVLSTIQISFMCL